MRIIHDQTCLEEGAAWLGAREPRFAMSYEMAAPLKLRRFPDGYDRLLSSIVSQQVSVAAAETIWRRMEGQGLTTPEAVLAAEDSALRGVGLSGQKVRYAKALAAEGIDYEGLRGLPTAAEGRSWHERRARIRRPPRARVELLVSRGSSGATMPPWRSRRRCFPASGCATT